MARYPLYVFDLDGTLFRGETVLPGAADAVERLRSEGAKIRYLTNNASQLLSTYEEKLRRMGFTVQPGETYSSASGTAAYLREAGVRSVVAIGEPGMVATLREVADVVNADAAGMVAPGPFEADAAVVGLCRQFTYDLMNGAMQAIRGGARFIATNEDLTYPLEGGRLIPGAGSLVAAVRACSGTQPFVVGKPNPFLAHLIARDAGVPVAEMLMVGDRLDTDIACGQAAGAPVHLVLTGVTAEPVEGVPWSEDVTGVR